MNHGADALESRSIGVAPKEYLLDALAKHLLRGQRLSVAERVGYCSASTLTIAFTRYVGVPLGRYARAL